MQLHRNGCDGLWGSWTEETVCRTYFHICYPHRICYHRGVPKLQYTLARPTLLLNLYSFRVSNLKTSTVFFQAASITSSNDTSNIRPIIQATSPIAQGSLSGSLLRCLRCRTGRWSWGPGGIEKSVLKVSGRLSKYGYEAWLLFTEHHGASCREMICKAKRM